MNDVSKLTVNQPLDTDIPIEITGMEYFGDEQSLIDKSEIVDKFYENTFQTIARFKGNWDGELDEAVRTAKKHLYTKRTEHSDYLWNVSDFTKFRTFKLMPIKLGFIKDNYISVLQMQRPGCVIPKHRDPKSILEFPGFEGKGVRVLIMLASWEYGQLMCFNNNFLTGWNKGDVIYSDVSTVWHFTANCSSHSRPLLQITGAANDHLLESIRENRFRTINI